MAITIDVLRNLLKEQKEEIAKDISEATDRVIKNTDEKVGILAERVDKLEKVVEVQSSLIEKQGALCASQEKRIVQLEVEARRKNIIIFKVDENESGPDELKTTVVNILNKSNQEFKLKTEDFESCYRLGKQSEGKIRPIKLTFIKYEKKQEVLLSKKTLNNFSISEDLPKEIMVARKPLIPKFYELKKQGIKAFFRLDELIVEGKVWQEQQTNQPENARKRTRSTENLQYMPTQLDEYKDKTKTTFVGTTTNINPRTSGSNPIKRFLMQQSSNTEILNKTISSPNTTGKAGCSRSNSTK